MNFLKPITIYATLCICVLLFLPAIGCSGIGETPVTSPDVMNPCNESDDSSHRLLGYWLMSVNEDHTVVEATPLRSVQAHFNVRTFLEDDPCTNCLSIVDVFPGYPAGTIGVIIELRHPFPGQDWYTGFDVRGIAMFPGHREFPAMGLLTSSAALGDAELLNPMGYTRLFNPVEYAPGTKPGYLQEYSQGKFANDEDVTSTLNGFIYFYTDHINRNYFAAGDVVQVLYHIDLPAGALKFGYAVDASWFPPSADPPSVPDDFPLKANCPEAYEITNNPIPMDGYYIDVCPGSSGNYRMFIHDHQGGETIQSVRVECPELYDGAIYALQYGQPGECTVYDVTITNEKATVEPGTYKALIEVTDMNASPVMHHIAYKMMDIIVEPNYLPESVYVWIEDGNIHYVGEEVQFHAEIDDPNGPDDIAQYLWDFNGDGFFEDSGPDPIYIYDTPGIYFVSFRWVDLCGVSGSTSTPIALTILPTGVQITLPEDQDYKTVGKTYIYKSEEMAFSDFPIDITDLDGPWDFTAMSLPDNFLNRAFLDKTDPEVAPVAGWYNPAIEYFYKYYGHIYDIDGSFFTVEEHNEIQDVLKIWGVYEPDDLGPIAFPSPIVVPFPINIDTCVHEEFSIPGYATFTYDYEVLGEGQVTVPYDGNATYDALMVRIFIKIETPGDFNASGLLYEWLEDDGKSVALIAAINRPSIPEMHFDETNLMYYDYGIISVNALESIEG